LFVKGNAWTRVALLVVSILYPATVIAQAQTTDQNAANAEAERVIIIGSNIPTAAEVGPNPVDTITRRHVFEKSPHHSH
jgi:hypothetical protein